MSSKLISWNSCGFNVTRQAYLQSILKNDSPDIVFVQEHHLLSDNLSLINVDSSYFSISTGALLTSLHGRPSGGCSILFKSSFETRLHEQFQISNRVCAVSLDKGSTLVVCVYFPCSNSSLDDYTNVIDEICQLVIKIEPAKCIIGGDFNTDLSRFNSSSVHLANAMESLHFDCSFLYSSPSEFTFSRDFSCRSFIDHFFAYGSLIDSFSVLHDPTNPSDHSPILMTTNSFNCVTSSPSQKYTPCRWFIDPDRKDNLLLDTERHFRALNRNSVFSCSDSNCVDMNHGSQLDYVMNSIQFFITSA